jgi:hypothetical protein
MSPGKWFTTFQRNVAIHSGVLDHKEAGTTALENMGNYSPNDTVQHPRKLQSSGKQLWEH